MNVINSRFQRGENAAPQHLDDIIIPDIEIDSGWPVSDVKTTEDCDDAFAFLMSACAAIEFDIDIEATRPTAQQNPEWAARAKCALKYKKAALSIVNTKRGRINEEKRRQTLEPRDRILLEYIRAHVPNDQFIDWVIASGCNETLRPGSEG